MANDIIGIVVTDNSDNVQINATPNLVSINVTNTSGNIIGSNYYLVSTFGSLPAIGDATILYVVSATSLMYRWNGSAYVQINSIGSINWGNINGTLSNQTDLQNALNAKAPLASPTFTGTVSGITKAMVGLGNVDNTTDANKPISTATQTALNLKYDATNPSGYITGITSGNVTTALGFTPYNATNPAGYTTNVGTVTSVGALTLGTSGTDVSSTVANGTTTPAITLNIPTASATNRGALSSTDWTTFNNKANALSGTTNTIPKFTSASAIGNSNITDTGSLISLGSNTTISSGNLGIGTTDLTGYNLRIAKNITGLTAAYGVFVDSIIQSDVTTNAYGYRTNLTTTSATFTLSNIIHYGCNQPALGANSTVTIQTGFLANSTIVGATSNYGFRGIIPSSANNFNLYMDGTAKNYLNGSLLIGSTTDTGQKLQVTGTSTFSNAVGIGTTSLGSTYKLIVNGAVNSSGAYIMDSDSGNFDVYSTVGSLTGGVSFNRYLGVNLYSANTNAIKFSVNSVEVMRILSSQNVLIGSTTDTGQRLQVTGTSRLNGTTTIQGTTASDTAPLGPEIATTGSGTNWTGTSFATGYTHTVGSTANLTDSSVAVIGTTYRVAVTITGRTAGGITIFYGGQNYATGQSITRQWARQAITTAGLVVTPTSDFDGTVVFNINSVGNSSASVTFSNSSGTVATEMRNDGRGNLFIGTNAGQKVTVVLNNNIQNTFIGNNAGQNNSNGRYNSFIGDSSGFSNSWGDGNTSVGQNSLSSNIGGSNNVALGFLALNNNTYGSSNIALGASAGRFIANGSTNNTSSLTSIFIGENTKALADSQINQIVIGHSSTGLGSNTTVLGNSSTVTSAIYGNLLLGSTTTTGNRLQVTGTSYFNGNVGIGITSPASTLHLAAEDSPIITFTRNNNADSPRGGINFYALSNLKWQIGTNLISFTTGFEFNYSGSNVGLIATSGNWLIGTTSDIASSKLTINSTTQGVLFPRMTTTQKNAIATPATGLVVFDTTLGKLCVFSTTWQTITSI